MIFLAITRSGVNSYQALDGKKKGAIWLGAGVLSDDELASLRKSGIDVSDFNYTIESHEVDVIAGAVETIREHHPGQTVWVEA